MPDVCPCCGSTLVVRQSSGGTRQLYCENEACPARLVRKFVHFCSKTRMEIKGLDEQTLTTFVQHGWVKNYGDLYELERHKEEILKTPGFGEKSFARLQKAVDERRTCTLNQFIAALGIPEVGRHAGRILNRKFGGSWDAFERAILDQFDFTQLEDFGQVMNDNIYCWYPVIIIDQYIPGIAAYIESIEQEVVFLFDEFDKTFGSVCPGANEADPQSALLSMFDGTAQGKKLFIVTCNSLYKLNDYLVNRPGRFHYHFRFDYPSPEEIQAYLTDKLRPAYIGEIRKVILFSKKVALNYDCLRAIAFELNLGLPFEKAIQDLNIINLHEECYNVTLHFHGGRTMTAKRCQLDLFGDDRPERVCLQDEHGRDQLIVEFDPQMCVYDYERHATIVPAEALSLDYIDYYEEETVAEIKKLVPDYLSLTRAAERNLHYLTA